MTKIVLGNHSAVFAPRAEQARIRSFYRDVLGCPVGVEAEQVDRVQLGDMHLVFVWSDEALPAADFQKAIYLEIATDDIEGLRRRIVDFGVTVLEIPDPHFYFQAPGGQVFKLVAIDEDLSVYETSTSSTPGAKAA